MLEHYEFKKSDRTLVNYINHKYELFQAAYIPFVTNIKDSLITWEHIGNLFAHFRDVMLYREIEGNTVEEIYESLFNYDNERTRYITDEIWSQQTGDRNLLMENLPVQEILNLN